GQPEAAMQSYQKALNLAQKLAVRDSADLRFRRSMGENYRHIGNLQVDFGEPDKGIEMLHQGLNIAEDVYSRQTGEVDDIVHLANAYEAVGNAELRLRNVAAALQNYRSMQQLWERSVADFPKDRASHGQAVCYFLVGAALAERGDLMAAMENFRRALAI